MHQATTRDVRPSSPQTILITGATGGIGESLCVALAQRGVRLILGVRQGPRAERLRAALGLAGTVDAPIMLPIDLSSYRSVREFAKRVREIAPRIDAAILNAAVVAHAREVTEDGFERQFAVNHLAHFLLAQELLPSLVAAAPSRVVVVASRAAEESALDFDDLQSARRYDHAVVYARSKRANVLFARALSRRVSASGVTVVSLHPGIVPTGLLRMLRSPAGQGPLGLRALTARARAVAGRVKRAFIPRAPLPRWWDTPEEAAARIVALLDAPVGAAEQGMFFVEGIAQSEAAWACDDDAAERLWKVSEQMVSSKCRSHAHAV
jgi:NAD(P)-dependent dehydrogenase (short-subunit alcohol dehydrogenase family)